MASLAEKLLELKKSEFNFSAAVQSDMAASLDNYVANENSNKVASVNADDKVVNFSLDAMGTYDIMPKLTGDKLGVLDEIQTIAIPAIPAEDGYLQEVDLSGNDIPGFVYSDASNGFPNSVFIPMYDAEGKKYTDDDHAVRAYKNNIRYQKEAEQNKVTSQQTADRNTIRRAGETSSSGQLASERALLDKSALIGLTTIKPSLEDITDGATEQTGSSLAIKSMDEVSTQLQADFKAQIEEENLYATATPLAQESLSDKARKDSIRLKEKENKEESIFAHNKFQNDRIDDIANKSDKAAEFQAERAAEAALAAQVAANNKQIRFEEAKKEAKINAADLMNQMADDTAKRLEAEKAHSDAMHVDTYGRNEDGSLAEAGTELSGLDRLEEEGFSQRLNQKLNEEKAAKIARVKELAETSPLGEEQDERLTAQKQQQNFESAKNNSTLGQNFGLKEEADRKLAKEKEEKRLYNEQITNADANADFSKTDTSPVANRNIGSKGRGEFRKLQAEKKAAKAKADAAVNASENAFQEDNGAVNTRDVMARGGHDDPYHFSTLAYPPDAVNSRENGHFMLFYVNVQDKTKYSYNGYKNGQVVPVGDMVETPVFINDDSGRRGGSGGGSKLVTQYHSGAKAAGIVSDIEYQKQMIRNGGRGNIIYNNQKMLMKSRKAPKSGINSKYPTTTRITDSVALYLPTGIGNTITAQYGDFATGVAGYLAMSGMDIGKAVAEDDFVGAASQLFDKGGTLITDAIKKLALAGLETLGGGEGLQQSFDKIFGQTLNPYIEVAFQSSGMRTFDYTFKFAPQSKAETDEVKAIIQLFRFHMLPEMKGTSHRYLTLPSTFDIHYMWQSGSDIAKENSFYNKIATCVLTSVDVNYTPNDEVQSFGDGAPTQISMALSFKETEMMTKQHINEGF